MPAWEDTRGRQRSADLQIIGQDDASWPGSSRPSIVYLQPEFRTFTKSGSGRSSRIAQNALRATHDARGKPAHDERGLTSPPSARSGARSAGTAD
jgi:hypothetical protein